MLFISPRARVFSPISGSFNARPGWLWNINIACVIRIWRVGLRKDNSPAKGQWTTLLSGRYPNSFSLCGFDFPYRSFGFGVGQRFTRIYSGINLLTYSQNLLESSLRHFTRIDIAQMYFHISVPFLSFYRVTWRIPNHNLNSRCGRWH